MKKLSDMLPNVTEKVQRKRDGDPVCRAFTPASEPIVEKMRVRILRNILGSRHGTFLAGQSVELPFELARSWIGAGLAEQDKILDSAPETK
jgi:hypothetical protein